MNIILLSSAFLVDPPVKKPAVPPPTTDYAPILRIIEQLSFRFAKTMPHIPNEYTVRSPETEENYLALFHAIPTGRQGRALWPKGTQALRATP